MNETFGHERNFCERCGKRLGKNAWDVHTCSPPENAPPPSQRNWKEEMIEAMWREEMIEQSKHYELAIICGAKRGPKDTDLTFSPASLRDFLKALEPQRQWVGLTDEERNHARQTVTYSQLAMTAAEWTDEVQKETERRLKEKNT